jgi:hypothetical protein
MKKSKVKNENSKEDRFDFILQNLILTFELYLSVYALNEWPQPQVRVALGLSKVNPLPLKPSW